MKGAHMMIVAKIDGKIVEVKKVAERVGFSDKRGWVLICTDFEQQERRKQHFKWIPASTRFEWVREYKFGE
jgi:hypothetical protein